MKTSLMRFAALLMLPLFFIACSTTKNTTAVTTKITPENALRSYLNNGDQHFDWEIHDSLKTNNAVIYSVKMTSQKWQDFIWRHQLTVFVPNQIDYDGALLFINGGSVKEEEPNWKKLNSATNIMFSGMATKNKAIVGILSQVPNQPLYNGLKEDALISKTFHDFQDDQDYSKPLLFPMVKSAVRAMDALQQFAKQKENTTLNRFVVSGASKRGWTTWLASAMDDRVVALVPMVIDILNMPVNLNYQLKAYGEYSEEINDYVRLGITDQIGSEKGRALVQMIDPYSYRKMLDKPKFLFMGTNDQYWVIDNIKNYYKDIPGKILIHYVPNAGHDLGGGVSSFAAMSAFFGITLKHGQYPEDKWKTEVKNGNVEVTVEASGDILEGVKVWSANSTDKDFRNEEWTSRDINPGDKNKFTVSEPLPQTGYHAFYVDMTYKDPNGGTYTVSTRAFMTDNKEIL